MKIAILVPYFAEFSGDAEACVDKISQVRQRTHQGGRD